MLSKINEKQALFIFSDKIEKISTRVHSFIIISLLLPILTLCNQNGYY